MNILRETMRRYTLDPYTIRVWRQADHLGPVQNRPDGDVLTTLRGQERDPMILAGTILALPNVNAVEIVNLFGHGDVLYRTQEIAIGGRTFQVI